MGYLSETKSMQKRWRRRAAAWAPHLDHTRRFVHSASAECPGENKAVVLGSGLLLDVPLAELASRFREVVLMDVVCLPGIRREIGKYRNVKFVEYDVTNVAGKLYENKLQGIRELPAADPDFPPACDKADFVVSLNILSQLWVIPRAYAITPEPRTSQEELDEWCRGIVEGHYAALRNLTGTVCLVSDYEYVQRDKEGSIFSRGSTVWGLSLAEPEATWTWNIIPRGEESVFYSKELSVGAWVMTPVSAALKAE
jgi:hypothetical protein